MILSRNNIRWLGVALAVLTVALYAPVLRCQFLDFDDSVYVTANRHVQAGVNGAGVIWAFSHPVGGNWHPVTVLSHMLDCQIYGLRPWGHHLTNVLLHAANTVLLFLLLTKLTGAVGRSLLVAALFAAHPAHVESVAWVAERKDVLCSFFFLLAIWTYVRQRRWWSVVLFALALMSKPMAVTLPFVLLLLDYWPLGRFPNVKWKSLITEKWPYLALSALWCWITVQAQGIDRAIATTSELSMGERLNHSLISYVKYMQMLVFPWHLAALYPYRHHEPILWGAGAALFLALVTWCAWRRTWLGVGWLWFVGMLVPVIGLVQVGGQAWADRYVYLPSIGFFIAVVWLGAEWTARFPTVKLFAPMLVAALALMTLEEIPYWYDTNSLFSRAMEVTTDNYSAMTLAAAAAEDEGNRGKALLLCRKAEELKPQYPDVHFYLGRALEEAGNKKQALEEYMIAVRLQPSFDAARVMAGLLLADEKKFGDAVEQYKAALEANPESAAAQSDWGLALLQQGLWSESIPHYQAALQLDPSLVEVHRNLAAAEYQVALASEHSGHIKEALDGYTAALEQNPDFPEALQHAAWILATDSRPEFRNGAEAVMLADRACELTEGKRPSIVLTLAAAEAEAGRFDAAAKNAATAQDLAAAASEKSLAAEAEHLRVLFTAKHPFHGQP
jgi:tetratricopeptide (TPR) repeat protein